MAFLRKGIGDNDPGSGLLSTALLKTLRWAAIPCLGVALVSWSAATLAGLHSAATLAYAGAATLSPLSIEGQLRQLPRPQQPATSARKMLVAPAGRPVGVASLSATRPKPAPAAAAKAPADPFGKVIAEAKLSREKLAAAFAKAGMAVEAPRAAEPADPFGKVIAEAQLSREKLAAAFAKAGMAVEAEPAEAAPVDSGPVLAALDMPAAERFHCAPHAPSPAPALAEASDAEPLSPVALASIGLPMGLPQLAYAPAGAAPGSPVELALASLALDPYGLDPYGLDDDAGPEAGEDDLPDVVDLPPARPQTKPAAADAKPGKPGPDKPAARPSGTADERARPARKPGRSDRQEPGPVLAYARPDKPGGSGPFKNLFGGAPKAGDKVAIYDISAAVVYMPDGSRLEAHSGIGKMADNPRYVHVKMNGPTPPNTYRLSMREKPFYGVEAIRMTPVGDQTMHGRNGILAHSYLVRGGRAESHGCVAFADYPKFLKAFKQGKVTHMIVVPSMSKMPKVRLAALGRGA